MTGELAGDAQMAQHHLTVRIGHRERARRRPGVVVLLRQRSRRLAIGRDASGERETRESPRLQPHPLPQADDRIEHRAGGTRERATVQRDGTVVAAAPAQKTRPAAFPFGRRLGSSIDAERVEGPGGRLGCGAWPASAEQSGTVRQVLGLDEQLAEGRVRHVVFLPPEHDLRVARDLDLPRLSTLVGEREASNFHVLFGRDHHLELRLDAIVGAAKHRALVRERDQVVFGFLGNGLVGRRPEPARADVAQVDEIAAGVGGPILPPARHRESTPLAGAAAGVGDHRDVRAVGEELGVRIEGVRRSEAPQARHRRDQRPPALLRGPRRFRRRLTRHPFLQEQLGRLDP